MLYKIPLILTPRPKGGYIVTSPAFRELTTEGDTVEQAMDNAEKTFAAVLDGYQNIGRTLPAGTVIIDPPGPFPMELLLTAK